jgi:SAM-dependent methyltransferase
MQSRENRNSQASAEAPMKEGKSEQSTCGCCGEDSGRQLAFFKPDDSQFTVKADRRQQDAPGWNLSYCNSCHVLSVDPLPSESQLSKIYEEGFYTDDSYKGGIGDWMMQKPLDVRDDGNAGAWKKWRRRASAKADLDRVRQMAEPLKVGDRAIRFLDIGCGTGETLIAAAKLGWNASGIELNQSAAAIARERSGKPVFNGRFEDFAASGEQYDIIHMGDVLEHLRHPHLLITWARDRLAPGGILRIQVPNDLAGYRMRWFSRIWWMFPPIHLHYFTPTSLTALLQRHGFTIARKGSLGGALGMDTRRATLWSAGLLTKADARAARGGKGALPLEVVRLLWDRILSVPLQYAAARSMNGFVFWVSAQKDGRTPE